MMQTGAWKDWPSPLPIYQDKGISLCQSLYYLCLIMEEPIVITVPYRGQEREFLLEWQPMGYTHRFRVEIDGVEVFFEPDEERSYRAMISPEHAEAAQKIDPALLQAVAEVLQDALN